MMHKGKEAAGAKVGSHRQGIVRRAPQRAHGPLAQARARALAYPGRSHARQGHVHRSFRTARLPHPASAVDAAHRRAVADDACATPPARRQRAPSRDWRVREKERLEQRLPSRQSRVARSRCPLRLDLLRMIRVHAVDRVVEEFRTRPRPGVPYEGWEPTARPLRSSGGRALEGAKKPLRSRLVYLGAARIRCV